MWVPPRVVKTVRDLIFWQYAKIIAGSAGFGKTSYGFVMSRFRKLQRGDIFWDEIREYVKEREKVDECIFCGGKGKLTREHLFPRALGGPNEEKNVVWVCARCNSSKGVKRVYEWWTRRGGLRAAKYDVPRIAEGKYLKLLYEVFEKKGFLDVTLDELRKCVCPVCGMKNLCAEEKTEGMFSPLCLDGIATLCFKGSRK